MRTDVKIGIAVGLLIVIGLAGYWAFSGWGPGEPVQPGTELASRNDGQKGGPAVGGPARGGRDSNTGEVPRFGGLGGPARPAVGTPPSPGPSLPVIRETPVLPPGPVIRRTPAAPEPSEPPVAVVIREAPTITEPNESPVAPVIADTRVMPRISESPVTPRISEAPVTPSIREEPITPIVPVVPSGPIGLTPAVTPGLGQEQTYVVKEGDAGFWAIAEKTYGDGRHWPLIAKANPTADSNALRAGQRLTIPPKPISRSTGGDTGEVVREGTMGVVGSGVYVVKKGDAGFWGIAQKVYGDGKYWPAIAKANPSLNSSALKPGDRLTMPAKPEDASGGPPPAVPTVVAGPGQKVYTIDKTDTSGFWGIAKRIYGDAMYWPLIAKANPSVSSSSLKVGQKLIVPELTDAMRSEMIRRPAATAPRTGAGERRPATAGRPVFD